MNEQVFVHRREGDWRRLIELCDIADLSPAKLTSEQLTEFVRLHRRISSDLAVARTQSSNIPLIEELNMLAGRAYGILYRSPRRPVAQVLTNTLAVVAQTFRRQIAFIAVSAFLLFGSAFFAFFITMVSPDVQEALIPPGFESSVEMWKTGKFSERSGAESTLATGFYASNNPRAAIMTGAIGAGTFGVMSVLLVVNNGMLMGALAQETYKRGNLDFLLSSISPHGVPELSGLVISGACGLLLGYALLFPGRRTRGDSLRAVGRDAITLLATSVGMMCIAAPIEGFFSFNPFVSGGLKMAVASVEVVGWAFFWSRYGK